MKRKPKFKKGQWVWLDSSDGLELVTIHKAISWAFYEIYNGLHKEFVGRGSLYGTQQEYERAMKKLGIDAWNKRS